MRTGIEIEVTAADRKALMALIAGRNTPAKVVWRAEIVLATADGCGTNEIILKRERRALDLLDLIRKGNQPSESEH